MGMLFPFSRLGKAKSGAVETEMSDRVRMSVLNDLNRRVLNVDLVSGDASTVEVAPEFYRKFLGGRGLNQYLLYQLLDPETSAFDTENALIFGAGLLSGTSVPGATGTSVDTKNTFSGGVGSANAGGEFSPVLKRAGYSTLIISGKADRPVFLLIDKGGIRIEPAEHLWGRTTSETVADLTQKLGTGAHVACIGPAGENRFRGASIMVERSRAAGKCGVGAVMGSKNLKAIAVCGTERIQVAEPETFRSVCRKSISRIRHSPAIKRLSKWGTKAGVEGKNRAAAITFRH